MAQYQETFHELAVEVDEAVREVDLLGRAVVEQLHFVVAFPVIGGEE